MQLTDLWGLWLPTPKPTDMKLDVGDYIGDITLDAAPPPKKIETVPPSGNFTTTMRHIDIFNSDILPSSLTNMYNPFLHL